MLSDLPKSLKGVAICWANADHAVGVATLVSRNYGISRRGYGMTVEESGGATEKPFAHMVYFKLVDVADPVLDEFLSSCVRYLSGHNGQIHFSVGLRAVDIQRDVSDTSFDVAMHMIFANRAKYDEYVASKPHDDFITATAGMSTGRRVLDSYIEEIV